MSDMTHGSLSTYTSKGCRCDLCTQAASEYNLRKRQERKEAGLPAGDPRHGTKNGYINYGCRCQDCRIAQTDPALAIRQTGFGYEVWIREERAWFAVGERVS